MNELPYPTPASVRYAFDYDPRTGVLTWAASRGRVAKGSPAGTCQTKGPNQYVSIQLDGRRIAAHRIAWAHFHGMWPIKEIDHIDGDGTNNRISNLRAVTSSENHQNLKGAKSHSFTGLLGAYRWRNKFKAQIVLNGKCKHVGTFDTKEAAHLAYVQAKRALHPMGTL